MFRSFPILKIVPHACHPYLYFLFSQDGVRNTAGHVKKRSGYRFKAHGWGANTRFALSFSGVFLVRGRIASSEDENGDRS